jgi:excisionase family DNA binding protein
MYNVLIDLRKSRGLLNIKELASILRMSITTLYRLAQKRQIPSLMLGGTRRFDPSVIEAWLIKKEPQLAVVARQLETAEQENPDVSQRVSVKL